MNVESSEMEKMGDCKSNQYKTCSQFDLDMVEFHTPKEGMEFDSEQAAFDFYKEYARRVGFGIRKRYANKSQKTGELTSRKFCCVKEGLREQDKRDYLTKQPRAETRCGCNAHMIISRDRETKKYRVYAFEAKHNHELQPPVCVLMIPAHRKISETQGNMADHSGVWLKAPHLGFIKQDQNNYLRSKRKRSLQYGEAGAILSYFKKQITKNPSFVYDLQMDSEEQITNIFWADAKMIIDYDQFGDVVTFDTTFKTNNEYRPFGVFVGFNHYKETVIFGAALLYDDTPASFQWLFETFLKTMSGKEPKTIFTSEDAAMAEAISAVMPETYHGLCIWRILQNAMKHLGHLFSEGSEFPRKFNACVFDYEVEEEFLTNWEELLNEYDPLKEGWLPNIFAVKEKWAKAYMNKVFSVGMRSVRLCESFNANMRNYLKVDLDIMQFFTHFQRVVDDKRYKEWDSEYNARHKLPKLKMKAPMLVQASEVYTPKIFEEFQEEYEEYQGAFIKERNECHQTREYVVAIYGQDKERKVIANIVGASVSCECRKFDTYGILCSHALKALDAMDIKLIPDKYILKRWTRCARSGSVQDLHGQWIQVDRKSKFGDRYKELCPKMVQLVNRACESHEAYTFLSKVHHESSHIVEQILERNSKTNDDGNLGVLDISYMLDNGEGEMSSKRKLNNKKTRKPQDLDIFCNLSNNAGADDTSSHAITQGVSPALELEIERNGRKERGGLQVASSGGTAVEEETLTLQCGVAHGIGD